MTNLIRSKYIIFENGRPIQLNKLPELGEINKNDAVRAIEKPKRGRSPKSMRVSEGKKEDNHV